MGEIAVLPAKSCWQWERYRHEGRILAGEESSREITVAFGDETYPGARLQTRALG